MKFFGQELGGYYDDGSEVLLIDDICKIKFIFYFYEDSLLGYWFSFFFFFLEVCGVYVSWFVSDRFDLLCFIGYVFIYFYGLERKVFVDFIDLKFFDVEFCNLFNEVVWLRLIFIENCFFCGYLI